MFDSKKLIFYRNLEYEQLIDNVLKLIIYPKDEIIKADIIKDLIDFAYEYNLSGNLWELAITFSLILNENAYSKTLEMNKFSEVSFDLRELVLRDLGQIKYLYDIDLISIDEESFKSVCNYKTALSENKKYDVYILKEIQDLTDRLKNSSDIDDFENNIKEFYAIYGVGDYILNKAFKVQTSDNYMHLKPITNLSKISFDDIIGYDLQKKKLNDNTLAFINMKDANNVLLFGDAGTGKSSSIKATINEYWKQGLRIIEINKYQFRFIEEVIDVIKDRNYRFIIYMDDLSFEDNEHEYKYLKAILEGGLANKPDNILIYATSNRRHLIRESFKDKEDKDEELHRRDTVEEKLSLAARFGVSIYYSSPNKAEFNNIVKELAKKADINFDEQEYAYLDGRDFNEANLIAEANKWELSHGGLSGRCAAQFITYIKTQVKYRREYEKIQE